MLLQALVIVGTNFKLIVTIDAGTSNSRQGNVFMVTNSETQKRQIIIYGGIKVMHKISFANRVDELFLTDCNLLNFVINLN
jgi:hypothetical protein